MAPTGSKSPKSAQERREAQREALRQQRRTELRRQRTVRTVVIAAITVVALVLVAAAGFLIYRATQPEGPVAVPEGMSQDQPYLAFGAPEDSGKPVLEVHLDFMCPYCGSFEETNGEDLATMIENDEATVNIVPRSMLDSASTTGDYSSRAANAMVCTYEEDPANAVTLQQLLFANQPAEGSAGLSDEELWTYAQEAGASESVQSCIEDTTYQRWVREVADPYGAETGGGTPYVAIDGEEFGDWTTPGSMRDAVLAAGGGAASDGGQG